MTNTNFEFSSAWTEEEKTKYQESLDAGIAVLTDIVGPPHPGGIWKIEKTNDAANNVGAIAVRNTRTLYISSDCPTFTFLHELYHVFHSEFDFGIGIFEEGLAIAASTLACQQLPTSTVFDYEDFHFIGFYPSGLFSDMIVPLDQFLPLLPMRYSLLGHFWLDAEVASPGLIKYLTQFEFAYYKFEPPMRIIKAIDVLEKNYKSVSDQLLNLWDIDHRDARIEKLKTNRITYFMPFYDFINHILYLISSEKKLTTLTDEAYQGEAIIETGLPSKVKLTISWKSGDGQVNEPEIDIPESGYKALSLLNIPELIGISATGYTLQIHDSFNNLIAQTDFTL